MFQGRIYCPVSFNPRSYKRSDACGVPFTNIAKSFQSTLLQEERQGATETNADGTVFQSTLLQEERRRFSSSANSLTAFNPRSYKRSDR